MIQYLKAFTKPANVLLSSLRYTSFSPFPNYVRTNLHNAANKYTLQPLIFSSYSKYPSSHIIKQTYTKFVCCNEIQKPILSKVVTPSLNNVLPFNTTTKVSIDSAKEEPNQLLKRLLSSYKEKKKKLKKIKILLKRLQVSKSIETKIQPKLTETNATNPVKKNETVKPQTKTKTIRLTKQPIQTKSATTKPKSTKITLSISEKSIPNKTKTKIISAKKVNQNIKPKQVKQIENAKNVPNESLLKRNEKVNKTNAIAQIKSRKNTKLEKHIEKIKLIKRQSSPLKVRLKSSKLASKKSDVGKKLDVSSGTKKPSNKSTDIDSSVKLTRKSSIDKQVRLKNSKLDSKKLDIEKRIDVSSGTEKASNKNTNIGSSVRLTRRSNIDIEKLQSSSRVLHIYCDGSCINNDSKYAIRRAGIGVFVPEHTSMNLSRPLSGDRLTNNLAEIEAAIYAVNIALEIISTKKSYEFVVINTDSNYIVQAMNSWVDRWVRNGWKLNTNEDVMHRDKFEKLIMMSKKFKDVRLIWNHVRGHSNISGNNEAHSLATKASAQR